MTDWQTGDVVANGIRIHYSRTGGDKPPLLLLHGSTDNGLCWTPVARQLAADYDVVMPDARGHGLSEAPPEGYSSAERAADAAALIGSLGLGQSAIGGHSMGGLTAFRLAVDYPELVRCAFLEDPPFRSTSTGPGANNARARMRSDVAEYRKLSREEVIEAGRRKHPSWAEDELPAWADAKLQVSEAHMTSLGTADELPWSNLAPRLMCATLLVTGDPERGAIVSPETAEALRRASSRVQVVRLPGAGHNIRREQFEPYMRAVREFLASAVVYDSGRRTNC